MRVERELMRGAGPVAVLKLLEAGPKYGYELVDTIARSTDGVLDMGQSTLYPLVYNLEAQGLVATEWREADSGRQRKYYRLTPKGKRRLEHDVEQWRAIAEAMQRLGILGEPGTSAPLGGATP